MDPQTLELIQYLGAFGFLVSLVPQLYRTVQRRSAEDVSLTFLFVLLLSSVLLLFWSLATDPPSYGLAASYAANLVVWGTVLYFRLRPGRVASSAR